MTTHKFQLETKGGVSALICNHCKLPFLTIFNGEIEIESKHGTPKHKNVLTMEHLRMLMVAMYAQTHPPERW